MDAGKGGIAALILGGKPEEESSAGEDAFNAFAKAVKSGDSRRGLAAFKELMACCDEDEDSDEEDKASKEYEDDESDSELKF